MDNALSWIEEHPWLAGAIGLGGLLVILWLLGFFSSSSSSQSQGNSLAAAYYNAEAAQTTAGTQAQIATEMYAAQTAQDQIQANGAEAIASTQANMYTTLGQQNAGTAQALGNDQLLATDNSNNDALAASNFAAQMNYNTALAAGYASNYNTWIGAIAPQLGAGNTVVAASGIQGGYGATIFNMAATPLGLQEAGYPANSPVVQQVEGYA